MNFSHVRGPERGPLTRAVRIAQEKDFGTIKGMSSDIFKKRFDRIIWELICFVSFDEIELSVQDVLEENVQ
ncbi:MAG: hypothetical protein H6Q69_4117 [Firmicutes bacterium]|nr:hypothetical protein [Bacillota bacterium]